MRKITLFIALFGALMTYAQGPVGEVTSEEIVIEKNKDIVLPKADKLFLPVTVPDLKRDSIRLTFRVGSPEFKIDPFSPQLVPFAYRVTREKLDYQNFFKLGYGSYGSPLISAFAGEQNKKLSWGAWVHHESFAKGSVNGSQSASSRSYADVFATFQNLNWALTPSLGWQNEGYRFYGYDESDPRLNNDKNSISRFHLGVSLEEIYDNDFTVEINPTFRSVNQNTPADAPSSAENYFDLTSKGTYQFDSTISAGVNLQFGAISFTSENTISRSFTKVNPWVGLKRKTLFVKVGVELASTNDTTISGTRSFFYPDISAEWSGLPGWTVYGKLGGELKPVTFGGLSIENPMLDDSLVMAHENIKTSFGGGIRGAINSKLHLNSGISLSSVGNMSFFMPSPSDSARFIITVDPENVTVFNLFGHLNWQPITGTHVGLRAEIFGYSTKTVDEAWYKPGVQFTMDWIQRFTDKISSRAVLTSIGGLKAPEPVSGDAIKLDTIIDLSLEGNYKITNRAEAFIQFQNVFSQEYQRFLNYPGRGISFKIGGKYRF